MSDVLSAFSVDADNLSVQLDAVAYPEKVPGRVAHIDADFLAYQVSAETADELSGLRPRKTLEDMQHNAGVAAEHLMRSCGATSYMCHITPSGSNKGGRREQSVQQEYQASRADKEKPEHLDAIRAFIGHCLNGVVHLDQEADDGLAQANYNATDRNLSVIVSRDKDLRMVPGLHYDFDTDSVIQADVFGLIWVDDTKSSKTMKGWGTKFFWAQCLMGDTADYIKGVPQVPGWAHCAVLPTKTYTKAMEQITLRLSPDHVTAAEKLRDTALSKPRACGVVLTFELLKGVKSDKEAFDLVRRIWVDCGVDFVHWNTGLPVTPTQALLGDMQLLWMRRNKNPLDVVDWLRSL